jgi:hypothetical protein
MALSKAYPDGYPFPSVEKRIKTVDNSYYSRVGSPPNFESDLHDTGRGSLVSPAQTTATGNYHESKLIDW